MKTFDRISNRTRVSVSVMLLLFTSAVGQRAFAQSPPLVYSGENSCANYAKPVFPSFDQLSITQPLPDPFTWMDGSGRDTSFASWAHHRCDIKAAIETYEIGPKPDPSDLTVTASYKATSLTRGVLTTVVTRNSNQKTITFTSNVTLPALPHGKFPVVIAMAFFPNSSGPDTGSIPSSIFTSRDIATVEFVHNQSTLYQFSASSHTTDPFYQMYPELCAGKCTGTSNSGQYAAWAWGVSRIIDGIEIATANSTRANPFPIDVNHIVVTGCSYAGKMALFAGAFDERVALTIAQESGGGGLPSWRVSHAIEPTGSVEDIDNTNYDWFGQQMKQFAGDNVYKLPEDHNELMAMVMPRALVTTGNTDYTWLSNQSAYVDARAAQKIYQTLGIGDRYGFYIDGAHVHCGMLNAEIPAIQSFVDKFLMGWNVTTDVEVTPFPTLDYQSWTWWWGTGNPSFPPGDNPILYGTGAGVSSNHHVVGGQAQVCSASGI